ncbi:MAG TPA: hypothetical protein VIC27_00550 [Ktedonobacterales bacterium]|jgi:uncharacterized membrane protein
MTEPTQPTASTGSESPAPEQSFPALAPHDPRTRAALCYVFPLLPGLYLLWRERRNRFVRLHAAQAVVFFSAVALAQIILFIALVALGNRAPGGWTLTVLGLAFWLAYTALGLGGFVLWLRLLNDCVHGRLRRRPLLSPLAARLEAASLQFTQSASAAYHSRRNGAR